MTSRSRTNRLRQEAGAVSVHAFAALRGSTSAFAIALAAPAFLVAGTARAQSIYQCYVPDDVPEVIGTCTVPDGIGPGATFFIQVPVAPRP